MNIGQPKSITESWLWHLTKYDVPGSWQGKPGARTEHWYYPSLEGKITKSQSDLSRPYVDPEGKAAVSTHPTPGVTWLSKDQSARMRFTSCLWLAAGTYSYVPGISPLGIPDTCLAAFWIRSKEIHWTQAGAGLYSETLVVTRYGQVGGCCPYLAECQYWGGQLSTSSHHKTQKPSAQQRNSSWLNLHRFPVFHSAQMVLLSSQHGNFTWYCIIVWLYYCITC